MRWQQRHEARFLSLLQPMARSSLAETSVVAPNGWMITENRQFASKKNKGNQTSSDPALVVRFVYSAFDMEEDSDMEEDTVVFQSMPKSKDFFKKLQKSFEIDVDSLKVLQFYDGNGEWINLGNPKQLEGVESPVFVRHPRMFDGEEYGYDEDDMDYDMSEDLSSFSSLETTIRSLIETLKKDGYSMSTEPLSLAKDGDAMSSRKWLLERAAIDTELQTTLLVNVGALDHIASCLDFPFLWNEEEATEGD